MNFETEEAINNCILAKIDVIDSKFYVRL